MNNQNEIIIVTWFYRVHLERRIQHFNQMSKTLAVLLIWQIFELSFCNQSSRSWYPGKTMQDLLQRSCIKHLQYSCNYSLHLQTKISLALVAVKSLDMISTIIVSTDSRVTYKMATSTSISNPCIVLRVLAWNKYYLQLTLVKQSHFETAIDAQTERDSPKATLSWSKHACRMLPGNWQKSLVLQFEKEFSLTFQQKSFYALTMRKSFLLYVSVAQLNSSVNLEIFWTVLKGFISLYLDERFLKE